MQFIKDSFADKVRTGKIKSPLRPDFSLEKWKSASKETEFDKKLELAGLIFHLQFSIIRQSVEEIKKANLPFSNAEFLQIFTGLANRDSFVLMKQMKDYIPKNLENFLDLELHEAIINNNPLNINLTISETVIGSIDGIYYNILSHLKKTSKIDNSSISDEDIVECIKTENIFSQLYNMFEQYWNSVLFEQVTFSIVDNKILLESNDELMIPYLIADARRTQKELHGILNAQNIVKKVLENRYFLEFKNGFFSANKFNNLNQNKKSNLENCYFTFTEKGISFLPKELPEKDFNITDVIEVFLQLNAISTDILNNFPDNDEILPSDHEKLKLFSPILDTQILIENLSLVTGKSEIIIKGIINFLTFPNPRIKQKYRSDLWRTPLIEISDNELLFVLDPILHPVGIRCFEGWMGNAGVNLDQKGKPFEEFIKVNLNHVLESNKFIKNFHIMKRNEISINGESEEIDLLVVIDNLIIIGEAKCIVSSDSATSYWHSLETIKNASEQIERKNYFIKDNLKNVFKELKWQFDPNIQYIIQPIVITSNGIGAGYSFFDVPIIDTSILINYFRSPICPLISNKQLDHSVYLKLYENIETLILNFQKFIENPPPIQSYRIYGSTINEIPIISPYDNFKITWKFKRLAIAKVDINKTLEHDFGFPMVINEEV